MKCPGGAPLVAVTTRTMPTTVPIRTAGPVPASARTKGGGSADAGVTPTQTPPIVHAAGNPSLRTA